MPKENINNRYLVPNQLTGKGPQPDTITFLQVGWDKAGSVQVGALAGGDYKSDTERPAFFVDLDRNSINQMIRALRRARDQAFGTDA